ncbi:hypothetical protein Pyn_00248 [Prunus yedoensis var. nudiflora]|uniref:Uncharacterized protein n=1 Tax=Prunus yedoensis var. nudiflora TaxID=2094558 RepID=A0A314Z1N5_PRUYE|nr:hypothetical protein Pyn_00248 [Prunus yedoensis var. nudiflora]
MQSVDILCSNLSLHEGTVEKDARSDIPEIDTKKYRYIRIAYREETNSKFMYYKGKLPNSLSGDMSLREFEH